jgi:hypothetical protein
LSTSFVGCDAIWATRSTIVHQTILRYGPPRRSEHVPFPDERCFGRPSASCLALTRGSGTAKLLSGSAPMLARGALGAVAGIHQHHNPRDARRQHLIRALMLFLFLRLIDP